MSSSFNIDDYDIGPFYDEMFQASGQPRPGTTLLLDKLSTLSKQDILARQAAAEKAFFDLGITFAVYGDTQGTEKIFPFDIIPRVIGSDEWQVLENGLKQRIYALNLFLDDIYHDRKIIRDKAVPADIIDSSAAYFPECMGLNPPRGVWSHITGTDLVRDEHGLFHVLEDNLRSPSGVSYVLANRQILKKTFSQAFSESNVKSVDNYPSLLLDMLHAIAPQANPAPNVVLLTPGVFNSAYYEHSYLAQQTGATLVEGKDLVVNDGLVYMRTTKGLIRVDVIYRRIGEDFLDPKVFRKDSLLGVPGIMEVYKKGNVALANAPGTGVADDKAVYAYVPDIIKYYLGEDPIIPNIPTYICREKSQLDHVLENLDKLVVKAANESGGYGMLVGPASTKKEQQEFASKIRSDPRNYIAQPTISLSRCPVIVEDHFEGRHVDFRPYVLYGQDIEVIPGGLTRVALKKGSLVVNSSQGGGSKDTWVLSQ
ncbi:circularly permuted type 2 ATP-grasp protein [Desulfonatronovibrio magnus]|uniref:circularly permuted type 2 ATP-grasp protein n=1 Tax=Desulfonatronovibrio magnus TaxID=698827 RepID=UPI0005EB9271|nr:circularly permuted type 2 ATP-grasp protein [Desulfonatronovibrio magnus]